MKETLTIQDALNDPQMADDYLEQEHLTDGDKSQELVTSITGSTEAEPARDIEVTDMLQQQNVFNHADKALRATLQTSKSPPVRVVQQANEIILRSVFCSLGVPTQLVADNYNRTKVIISGAAADVVIGKDQNINANIVTPPFNATVVAVAAQVTIWTREYGTVRELWACTSASIFLGVQEEFHN